MISSNSVSAGDRRRERQVSYIHRMAVETVTNSELLLTQTRHILRSGKTPSL